MAIFFMHLRQGTDFLEDFEGGEFVDLAAARQDAVVAAREIMCERLKRGEQLNGQSIEICNEAGQMLDTVPFRSVYRVS